MNYIPFLKLKSNEVAAFKALSAKVADAVTPLFDIPRIKDMNEEDLVDRIGVALRSMKSNWKKEKPFYLDVFDIPPQLKPEGDSLYSYCLKSFSSFNIIPVVGLDRDDDHLSAVSNFFGKDLTKKIVGVRLLASDFVNFDAVKDEIDDILGEVLNQADAVDLILDARNLTKETVVAVASSAAEFAKKFVATYGCRQAVITGSSIPSSAAAIVGTNEEKYFERLEKRLWGTFFTGCDSIDCLVSFGDYGVVSPEYSDVDLIPEMMPNVATPKIIYTSDDIYYAVRGAAFKTHAQGYGQYYNLAQKVSSKKFFRGPAFCAGDKYIYERGGGAGTTGSPGSWIKVGVNSHISFVAHLFAQ